MDAFKLDRPVRKPEPFDSFIKYASEYQNIRHVSRDEALVICFDDIYSTMKIPLEEYKGEWICYAYSDSWFQAFGHDATAEYTTTKTQDESNDDAMKARHSSRKQPTTADHNLPPTQRLHFNVDNRELLFLFNLPVHAHATAETLNIYNTRLRVDFGFGAPARGNYLIIGYKRGEYAVVGDFDLRYLWFLVREGVNVSEDVYKRMKQRAIDFGYSANFIARMNYRDAKGFYHKGVRTYAPSELTSAQSDEIMQMVRRGELMIPGPGNYEGASAT
jgi:lipocalin